MQLLRGLELCIRLLGLVPVSEGRVNDGGTPRQKQASLLMTLNLHFAREMFSWVFKIVG